MNGAGRPGVHGMVPTGIEEVSKSAVCVGCGLTVNGDLLEVELRPNGGIGCQNTGAATDGLFLDQFTSNTNCITLTGEGTQAAPTVATINLSEDACNGIACRANGLYAPCPDNIVGAFGCNDTEAILPFTAVGPNNFYRFPSCVVNITNDLCCQVAGRTTVQVGGMVGTLDPGTVVHAIMDVDIDGGGFIEISPPSNRIVHNNDASNTLLTDLTPSNFENNFLSINAGATVTYQGRLSIFVVTGSVELSALSGNTVRFEFVWDLNQIGCC